MNKLFIVGKTTDVKYWSRFCYNLITLLDDLTIILELTTFLTL